MIKRRFYKVDHGDRDAESDDSSSSGSDADSSPSEEDRDDVSVEEEDEDEKENSLSSPGSGYESEDSSGDEVDFESSGFISNEEESPEGGGLQQKICHPSRKARVEKTEIPSETGGKSSPRDLSFDQDSCILKYKSVFKCKLCPNIICLNENTIGTHLSSKRHARSKKQLEQGRLKLMLNSDGEIEEEQETHAERHARTVAITQRTKAPAKKDNVSKRKRWRRSKKIQQARGEKLESAEKPSKKQRKSEDPKKLEESTKRPSKKQRKSEDPRKLEESTKRP